MLLSVIVPVYNEEATLETIISKVRSAKLPAGVSREIVIVNDGSKDGTKAILDRLEGTPGVTIRHQNNQGKTGALLTAIKLARGDVFIVQDADLEYDPAQFEEMLQLIIDGKTHVVYGSRFLGNIEGMKPINRWANNTSNMTLNLLYGTKITDINTCYKMFTRKSYEGIEIKGSHFDMDTELTVKLLKRGYGIIEVPIRYVARPRHEGKKIKWSTAIKMWGNIIKYRFVS